MFLYKVIDLERILTQTMCFYTFNLDVQFFTELLTCEIQS